MPTESPVGVDGVVLSSRQGRAYGEAAFRYFLALERQRCERSGRTLVVLLVHLHERAGVLPRIDRTVASKIFSCLWLSVRETDVVGWYRDERVVGAVLAQHRAEQADPEAPHLISGRVRDELRKCLSKHLLDAVHLHVRRVRPRRRSNERWVAK
jgi:hypothetical protein